MQKQMRFGAPWEIGVPTDIGSRVCLLVGVIIMEVILGRRLRC